MFTKGIWKDIYLVRVGKATISHVVPQVEYLGAYPTARLVDGHAPFEVRVQVHIVAPAACVIEVAATGEWGGQNSTTATLPAGGTMVELVLPADSVNLWWPNNAGSQTMYNVNVSLGATTAPIATSSRRIGFRFLAFVTEDDQDPAAVLAKGEGTGSFTVSLAPFHIASLLDPESVLHSQSFRWIFHQMRFRVNGVNLYVRGSNLIPMEVVEGRANATALHRLVQSARDANFNMLRVWYAISTCWLSFSLDVCTWWACQHCSHWTYDLPMLSQGRRYLPVLGIL
jgi:beta-mannosidase